MFSVPRSTVTLDINFRDFLELLDYEVEDCYLFRTEVALTLGNIQTGI